MNTTALTIAFAVIIFLTDLWASASVLRSTKASGTKVGWVVLIFVLPILGIGIWGLWGPRGIAQPPTSDEHSKG